MATLFSTTVGFWQQPSQRVNGTLTGTVVRSNATTIKLTDLSLGLSSAPNVYQGTKILRFTLGDVTTVLNITGGSSYLGTFTLQDVQQTIPRTQRTSRFIWRTSDGYSSAITVTTSPYPEIPTVEFVSKTPNSITVQYGTDSFGDDATGGTVSLKAHPLNVLPSVIDTYDQTGLKTFTYTGLEPETTYYFSATVTNSFNKESFTPMSTNVTTPKAVAMYGSVNNFAKNIDKIYGSLNGQTKEIAKIYGSLNGVTKRIF